MYAKDLKDLLSPRSRARRFQVFIDWRDNHTAEISRRIADRTYELRRLANSVDDGGEFSIDATYHQNPKGLQKSRFEELMLTALKFEVLKRLCGHTLTFRLARIETVAWEPAKYDPHSYDTITFRAHYIVSR